MLQRGCDVCQTTDDHPRHIHANPDGSTFTRHLDCCAEAGCPDGSCTAIASELDKPLRGAALRKHLKSGAVDHVGVDLNQARATVAKKGKK